MDYKISSFLTEQGIEQIIQGVCTGTQWFEAKEELQASVSPADGLEITFVRQINKYDQL